MFATLQNPLALVGRILIALLFIPAGFGKISGFAGTVGLRHVRGHAHAHCGRCRRSVD